LWRHALPNALQSLVVMAVFSIAGAILLEASLSFLGFGGEQFKGVSWGSLLSIARKNPADWWVAVFPGLMIGLTLLSLYKIGLQREAHLI
jgi:peptide/nickel transport system permease protein